MRASTRRTAAQRAAMARAQERVEQERLLAAALPSSESAFCERAAKQFWMGWSAFHRVYMQGQNDSGYRLSPGLCDRLHVAATQLYYEIGQAACNGEVEFEARKRAPRLQEAMAEASQADVTLQRLLKDAHNMESFFRVPGRQEEGSAGR